MPAARKDLRCLSWRPGYNHFAAVYGPASSARGTPDCGSCMLYIHPAEAAAGAPAPCRLPADRMSDRPRSAWSPCGNQLVLWCAEARHAIIAQVLTGVVVTLMAETTPAAGCPGDWHWASTRVFLVSMEDVLLEGTQGATLATVHNAATGDVILAFQFDAVGAGREQFLWASDSCFVPATGETYCLTQHQLPFRAKQQAHCCQISQCGVRPNLNFA